MFNPLSNPKSLFPSILPLFRSPGGEGDNVFGNNYAEDGSLTRSASRKQRPIKGNLAFLFNLGTKLDEERRNASIDHIDGEGIARNIDQEAHVSGDNEGTPGPQTKR